MKTSEFIKYFEDEGLIVEFDKYGEKGVLVSNDAYELLFDIYEDNRLDTDYDAFSQLNFSKQQEYYKVIFDYLMTPVEEREEEKRYYLKLKGFDGEQPYLCAYDFWNAWILIEKDSFTHGDEFYFKFTEENIKNLPEELKAHNWEQIEVGVRIND